MYPIVICVFFLSVVSAIPTVFEYRGDSLSQSLAANFCAYRSAVLRYLSENDNVVTIPNTALPLPAGYVYLSQWQTRIIGEHCYIYGAIETDELYIIRKKLGNSLLVGQNQAGSLFPSGVTVPAAIPSGTIVSIVSVEQ